MTTSNQWYLGHVDYNPIPHTRISCIAKVVNGAWKKQNLVQELPPLGKIFAPSRALAEFRDNNIEEDSLIALKAELNPELEESEKDRDHYIVTNSLDAEIPKLVLDFRTKTIEEIRYAFIEYGLDHFENIHLEIEEVIIAINDTQCLILDLEEHPTTKRYVTTVGKKDVYEFDSRIFNGDKFNGYFLEVPDTTVGEWLDDKEWKLDQDILKSLLKQLKPYDGGNLPSKNEVERIIPVLNRALDLLAENKNWENEKEWLESYIARATNALEIPKNLIEQLVELDPIRSQIELHKLEIKEKYYQELKATAKKEIETEFEELTKQQLAVKQDISEKHISLIEIQDNLTELEKQYHIDKKEHDEILAYVKCLEEEAKNLEEYSSNFTQMEDDEKYKISHLIEERDTIQAEIDEKREYAQDLEEKSEEIEQNFITIENQSLELEIQLDNLKRQLILEISQLNQVLGNIDDLENSDTQALINRFKQALGESGKLLAPIDSNIPPWSQVKETQAEIIDFSQLPNKLIEQAFIFNISNEVLGLLDIALRSGTLTVLPQHLGELLISKYAQVITGGQFYRETLGMNILNLEDLWIQPNRGTKTGFARAWMTAINNPDFYHIVWLDGLQHTAMDLWLPSFIGLLKNEQRPKNLLVVATIDENFVEENRIWQDLKKYCLPINYEKRKIRFKGLVDELINRQKALTKLTYEEFKDIPSLLSDRDALEDNESLAEIEVELRLYLAQGLLENQSVLDRLKEYATLRGQGREWLGTLLKN